MVSLKNVENKQEPLSRVEEPYTDTFISNKIPRIDKLICPEKKNLQEKKLPTSKTAYFFL